MHVQNRMVNHLLRFLITALLFYYSGKFALTLALPPSNASSIWPPAGIGFAAVLLWGYYVLPAIFIAELLIDIQLFHASISFDSPQEMLILLLAPANNVLRSWLACVLVKKILGPLNGLISARSIILFFLLAGPIACFLPALINIYTLLYSGVITQADFVFSFLTWWSGDCIGIAVFTPIFFIIFDRSNSIWKQRRLSLGIPLVFVCVLGAVMYLFFQQRETERLQSLLSTKSQVAETQLLEEYQNHVSILYAFKSFFTASEEVNKTEFNQFSFWFLKKHPDIVRIDWIEINDLNSPENLFDFKFSVFNQGYESSNLNNLKQALLSGLTTKSDSLVKSYYTPGNREFVLFLPVLSTNNRATSQLKGYFSMLVNLDSFITMALDKKLLEHIIFKILASDNESEGVIYQSAHKPENDPLELTARLQLNLGEQRWRLELIPSDTFLSKYYSWSVWVVLAGGMIFSSILSIGLLVLTGQAESIRNEVSRRTDELKQSHRKLRVSEEKFRRLVSTQSAIFWQVNPDTYEFTFISDEVEKILGYPKEQWLNDAYFWQQHIHPDDREYAKQFCLQQTKLLKNHEFEYRMIAQNGTIVWLKEIVNLVIENGKVTQMFGFMTDISTQKRLEEQLRLAAITFECKEGIMITNKDGNILRVNKSFTEITGFSADEIEGQNPRILKSNRHDLQFYNKFWSSLLLKGFVEGEIWNRRKNGEIYPEWQAVTAVKDETGEITHFVSIFTDITEKKDIENRIYNMAFYDPLTSLPNRRLLMEKLGQELSASKRHNLFGAVLFLDLDDFKLLNDSLGHHVGDDLLVQVAIRLADSVRQEDIVSRLGGDEFVILLHANSKDAEQAADHALTVAEKIREILNEPYFLTEYQHQLSSSIGIALFPEQNEMPETVLQQADTAMYRSKSSGRNAISFFHPSMQQAADKRLLIEKELRVALEENQFYLVYQPQVDADEQLLGLEALLRWGHPDKGVISPGEFIAVAEESQLILSIGEWVLQQVCEQVKAWQLQAFDIPYVAVNVSSRQFRQVDFVELVRKYIDKTGIEPTRLQLELTEGVMIDDINETIKKMQALKRIGVSIAVDDFGTGYSSLAYLKQLPLDALKIDQGFVRDILTDKNDCIIVETIIDMAKNMRLKVIAEGVETKEQFVFLNNKGGVSFQGYYFSLPLLAEEVFEKYVDKESAEFN